MPVDAPPVADARCFLCGRVGATPLGPPTPEDPASGAQSFAFECETCGPYVIRAMVGVETAAAEPVEMESAALDIWNKTLEAAERQRRLTKRATEPEARLAIETTTDRIACA